MSGIGFSELVILFVIGLIVLGPERLPRVANQLGTWLGQARRMTRVMKRQLEDELSIVDDLRIQPPAYTPRDDDTYSPVHTAGSDAGDADNAPTDPDSPDAPTPTEKSP